MTEELTTTIYFAWKSVMPDTRQYKQNGTVLELDDVFVAFHVPLTSEYIFNQDKVIAAQLDGNLDVIKPLLTPAGMRYCIDELEKVMSEPEFTVEPTEDWEEETKTDDTVSTTHIDDWSSDVHFDEGDAGKADNELWESNEDDWK